MLVRISTRTTLTGFLLCVAIFSLINYLMVAPYLVACIMGALLAIISHPLFVRLNRRLNRKWSAVIVTLGLIVVVIGPMVTLLVFSIQEAIVGVKTLLANSNFDMGGLLQRVSKWGFVQQMVGDPQHLQQKIGEALQNFAGAASAFFLSGLSNLPEILLVVALVAITCYFSLVDGPKFMDWLRARLPLDADVREEIFVSVKSTSISAIFGTILASAAQAATMGITFLALGMPKVLLAIGVTFVFACIPLCGSAPVWIGATIYLYFTGAVVKAIIMLVAGLFTGIVDNIVRAAVLSGDSKIHPLISLLSLFGGIHLFGIWGLFVGPVFTACLLVLLDIWPKVARSLGLFQPAPSLSLDPEPSPTTKGAPSLITATAP